MFAFKEMGSRGGNRFDLLFPKDTRRGDNGGGGGGERDGGGGSGGGGEGVSEGNDEGNNEGEGEGESACEDAAFVHSVARRAPWVKSLVNPLLSGVDGDEEVRLGRYCLPRHRHQFRILFSSEEERDASACIRRHQASALVPVR